MSGTSLDGIDIVLCSFYKKDQKIKYIIHKAETIDYTEKWKNALKSAHNLKTYDFLKFNNQYGQYIEEVVNTFLYKNRLSKADIRFIASHGHTIFHNPNENITCQIGDGTNIYVKTGIKVIHDFRSLDVALKGQGAPLVPIGDELLFNDYHFCLNLGGFANISYIHKNRRIAYDIVPTNIILNKLASQLGHDFDDEGKIAAKGTIQNNLLTELNTIQFYKQPFPKSLGREWVENTVYPILSKYNLTVPDILQTFTKHICHQITNAINNYDKGNLLITGGGAHNMFLINRLRDLCKHDIVIPTPEIINYKEALIFALLGWLKENNQPNTMATCTGATRNAITGITVNE